MMKRAGTGIAALAGLLFLNIQEALATEEAAHEGGGLPQFDPSSWSSQIFWLLVMFAFLYVFFTRKTLPEISATIDNRRNHIQSDLDTAKRLTVEAEAVQKDYEDSLEKARSEAAGIISAIEEDMKEKAESEVAAFREKFERDIHVAEGRIVRAKDDALGDMNEIAVGVAREAVAKIAGLSVDERRLRTIVESLSESRAKAA